MILSRDRNPTFSLYYIGAIILSSIDTDSNVGIDALYEKITPFFNNELPVNYFYYSLDWLYLLEKIKLTEGRIEKC